MDTTVITQAAHDFGAGKDQRIQFVGCRWKVDERGTLHVYEPAAQGMPSVSVAAFAHGAWLAATNGRIQGDGVNVSAVAR